MYLSEVKGKGGIEAKVVAASVANGVELWTIETKAPKFIDAELRTHRMLSQNSSSSRAIPFKPLEDIYIPFDLRKNQKGMQGYEKADEEEAEDFVSTTLCYYNGMARDLYRDHKDHIHKQHLNRYIEPWMFQKKIITGTEWVNFFKLRLAPEAQPEIQELARCMKEAMLQARLSSKAPAPIEMAEGAWHLPYIRLEEFELPLEELRKLSVARCARVSYMNHDKTDPVVEKDLDLYDMLLSSGHMSPFEHQATPMELDRWSDWRNIRGVTHISQGGSLWSGNFREWIQNRQLVSEWNAN